jgi:hypothetical protein
MESKVLDKDLTQVNKEASIPSKDSSVPSLKAKTLDNVDPTTAKSKVLDIKIFGDPNAWLVLSKASSEREGWMKSTKVLPVDGVGCLLQVSTQQMNPDGSYSLAEALQWVPGVRVDSDKDANGNIVNRKLRHL